MAVGTLPTRGVEYTAEALRPSERSRLWRKLSRNPLALLGGVMVFRMANAAARAQLGWKTIGPREVETVRGLARELVASLEREGRRP